jgi:hypothetical protein
MTLSTFSYQKALCHKINASVKKALEKFSAQKKLRKNFVPAPKFF